IITPSYPSDESPEIKGLSRISVKISNLEKNPLWCKINKVSFALQGFIFINDIKTETNWKLTSFSTHSLTFEGEPLLRGSSTIFSILVWNPEEKGLYLPRGTQSETSLLSFELTGEPIEVIEPKERLFPVKIEWEENSSDEICVSSNVKFTITNPLSNPLWCKIIQALIIWDENTFKTRTQQGAILGSWTVIKTGGTYTYLEGILDVGSISTLVLPVTNPSFEGEFKPDVYFLEKNLYTFKGMVSQSLKTRIETERAFKVNVETSQGFSNEEGQASELSLVISSDPKNPMYSNVEKIEIVLPDFGVLNTIENLFSKDWKIIGINQGTITITSTSYLKPGREICGKLKVKNPIPGEYKARLLLYETCGINKEIESNCLTIEPKTIRTYTGSVSFEAKSSPEAGAKSKLLLSITNSPSNKPFCKVGRIKIKADFSLLQECDIGHSWRAKNEGGTISLNGPSLLPSESLQFLIPVKNPSNPGDYPLNITLIEETGFETPIALSISVVSTKTRTFVASLNFDESSSEEPNARSKIKLTIKNQTNLPYSSISKLSFDFSPDFIINETQGQSNNIGNNWYLLRGTNSGEAILLPNPRLSGRPISYNEQGIFRIGVVNPPQTKTYTYKLFIEEDIGLCFEGSLTISVKNYIPRNYFFSLQRDVSQSDEKGAESKLNLMVANINSYDFISVSGIWINIPNFLFSDCGALSSGWRVKNIGTGSILIGYFQKLGGSPIKKGESRNFVLSILNPETATSYTPSICVMEETGFSATYTLSQLSVSGIKPRSYTGNIAFKEDSSDEIEASSAIKLSLENNNDYPWALVNKIKISLPDFVFLSSVDLWNDIGFGWIVSENRGDEITIEPNPKIGGQAIDKGVKKTFNLGVKNPLIAFPDYEYSIEVIEECGLSHTISNQILVNDKKDRDFSLSIGFSEGYSDFSSAKSKIEITLENKTSNPSWSKLNGLSLFFPNFSFEFLDDYEKDIGRGWRLGTITQGMISLISDPRYGASLVSGGEKVVFTLSVLNPKTPGTLSLQKAIFSENNGLTFEKTPLCNLYISDASKRQFQANATFLQGFSDEERASSKIVLQIQNPQENPSWTKIIAAEISLSPFISLSISGDDVSEGWVISEYSPSKIRIKPGELGRSILVGEIRNFILLVKNPKYSGTHSIKITLEEETGLNTELSSSLYVNGQRERNTLVSFSYPEDKSNEEYARSELRLKVWNNSSLSYSKISEIEIYFGYFGPTPLCEVDLLKDIGEGWIVSKREGKKITIRANKKEDFIEKSSFKSFTIPILNPGRGEWTPEITLIEDIAISYPPSFVEPIVIKEKAEREVKAEISTSNGFSNEEGLSSCINLKIESSLSNPKYSKICGIEVSNIPFRKEQGTPSPGWKAFVSTSSCKILLVDGEPISRGLSCDFKISITNPPAGSYSPDIIVYEDNGASYTATIKTPLVISGKETRDYKGSITIQGSAEEYAISFFSLCVSNQSIQFYAKATSIKLKIPGFVFLSPCDYWKDIGSGWYLAEKGEDWIVIKPNQKLSGSFLSQNETIMASFMVKHPGKGDFIPEIEILENNGWRGTFSLLKVNITDKNTRNYKASLEIPSSSSNEKLAESSAILEIENNNPSSWMRINKIEVLGMEFLEKDGLKDGFKLERTPSGIILSCLIGVGEERKINLVTKNPDKVGELLGTITLYEDSGFSFILPFSLEIVDSLLRDYKSSIQWEGCDEEGANSSIGITLENNNLYPWSRIKTIRLGAEEGGFFFTNSIGEVVSSFTVKYNDGKRLELEGLGSSSTLILNVRNPLTLGSKSLNLSIVEETGFSFALSLNQLYVKPQNPRVYEAKTGFVSSFSPEVSCYSKIFLEVKNNEANKYPINYILVDASRLGFYFTDPLSSNVGEGLYIKTNNGLLVGIDALSPIYPGSSTRIELGVQNPYSPGTYTASVIIWDSSNIPGSGNVVSLLSVSERKERSYTANINFAFNYLNEPKASSKISLLVINPSTNVQWSKIKRLIFKAPSFTLKDITLPANFKKEEIGSFSICVSSESFILPGYEASFVLDVVNPSIPGTYTLCVLAEDSSGVETFCNIIGSLVVIEKKERKLNGKLGFISGYSQEEYSSSRVELSITNESSPSYAPISKITINFKDTGFSILECNLLGWNSSIEENIITLEGGSIASGETKIIPISLITPGKGQYLPKVSSIDKIGIEEGVVLSGSLIVSERKPRVVEGSVGFKEGFSAEAGANSRLKVYISSSENNPLYASYNEVYLKLPSFTILPSSNIGDGWMTGTITKEGVFLVLGPNGTPIKPSEARNFTIDVTNPPSSGSITPSILGTDTSLVSTDFILSLPYIDVGPKLSRKASFFFDYKEGYSPEASAETEIKVIGSFPSTNPAYSKINEILVEANGIIWENEPSFNDIGSGYFVYAKTGIGLILRPIDPKNMISPGSDMTLILKIKNPPNTGVFFPHVSIIDSVGISFEADVIIGLSVLEKKERLFFVEISQLGSNYIKEESNVLISLKPDSSNPSYSKPIKVAIDFKPPSLNIKNPEAPNIDVGCGFYVARNIDDNVILLPQSGNPLLSNSIASWTLSCINPSRVGTPNNPVLLITEESGFVSCVKLSTNLLFLDKTPPSKINWVKTSNYATSSILCCQWEEAIDEDSGIARYFYRVLNDEGTITNWISVGSATLSISIDIGTQGYDGASYWFEVKAENSSPIPGTTGVTKSNGVLLDLYPPSSASLYLPSYGTSSDSLLVKWGTASDSASGVKGYELGILGGVMDSLYSTSETFILVMGTFTDNTLFNVSLQAIDNALWRGSLTEKSLLFDLFPPSPPPNVILPEYSTLSTLLYALWDASSDSASGIKGYLCQVFKGTESIIGWIEVGTNTSSLISSSYSNNSTYSIKVKVEDNAGWIGEERESNLCLVDLVKPKDIAYVNDGLRDDATFTSSLSANWGSSSDNESGLKTYWYGVGTSLTGFEILDWTPILTTSIDLGTQFPHNTTYYFKVRAEDNAGWFSNITYSNGALLDLTPPLGIDKVLDDGYFTNGTQSLNFSFSPSSDPESGILFYEYAIGTMAKGTNVRGFTEMETNTEFIAEDLSLLDGIKYYISVRPVNGALTKGFMTSSDGIIVDISRPSKPYVFDEGTWTSNPTELFGSWTSYAHSGIKEYWYCIGTQPSDSSIKEWTNMGTRTSTTTTGLSLSHSQVYYFSVKAKSFVGGESEIGVSDGIMVDLTPPNPPGSITINDTGEGTSLIIKWENPSEDNFSYIKIYRSEAFGSLGSLFYDKVKGESIKDSGLVGGKCYFYTLRSVDFTGVSSTNTDQYAGTPTILSATSSVKFLGTSSVKKESKIELIVFNKNESNNVVKIKVKMDGFIIYGMEGVAGFSFSTETDNCAILEGLLLPGSSATFVLLVINPSLPKKYIPTVYIYNEKGVERRIDVSGELKVISENVSGEISSDTTWNIDGSPWIITGDVYVKKGVTLSIESGVMVRFEGLYHLEVLGTLNAIGSIASHIVFTSNKEAPNKGDWECIYFNGGSGRLEYVDMFYSGGNKNVPANACVIFNASGPSL
ncbi:MAG: fibronectin type III domain-containing protein, partial [bacterium]